MEADIAVAAAGDSPAPLADRLRAAILAGTVPRRSRLCTDADALAAQYGVEPADAQAALETLRGEGLLQRRTGAQGGWVVVVPVHELLAERLRADITSGQLQPGQRLFAGNETTVADHHGVSRETVNRALRRLMTEGLVESRRGRHGGWFVRTRSMMNFIAWAPDATRPGGGSTDQFFSAVLAQGCHPSQDFFCFTVPADAEIAGRLEVTVGDPLTVRRCVRRVNRELSSVQDTYYPQWLCDRVPQLRSPDDIAAGTTALLTKLGFEQLAFVDEVVAMMPAGDHRRLLHLDEGTPVLCVITTAYGRSGPLRVTCETCAGDRNRRIYRLGDHTLISTSHRKGEP